MARCQVCACSQNRKPNPALTTKQIAASDRHHARVRIGQIALVIRAYAGTQRRDDALRKLPLPTCEARIRRTICCRCWHLPRSKANPYPTPIFSVHFCCCWLLATRRRGTRLATLLVLEKRGGSAGQVGNIMSQRRSAAILALRSSVRCVLPTCPPDTLNLSSDSLTSKLKRKTCSGKPIGSIAVRIFYKRVKR